MSVIKLNTTNFVKEAIDSDKTVLIDFFASWCGPCKMLSPIVDEIAESDIPELKVCKVDTDEASEIAAQFGIMSIPTLVVLKNGREIHRSVGLVSKEAILNMLK